MASRSEVLSVMFYYAAVCVFLYKKPAESISIWRRWRSWCCSAAALTSKEHTLTLPVLLLLLDLAWVREGWRKNALLYGMMAAAGAVGAFFVARLLSRADSAGLSAERADPDRIFLHAMPRDLELPSDVFAAGGPERGSRRRDFAEPCWMAALSSACWLWRRWPRRLGFTASGCRWRHWVSRYFSCLLAPTSSFVPIADVQLRNGVYTAVPGAGADCLEFLRRLKFAQIVGVGVAVLAVCTVLTYQRSEVWASSLALWQDAAAKSPKKVRPQVSDRLCAL